MGNEKQRPLIRALESLESALGEWERMVDAPEGDPPTQPTLPGLGPTQRLLSTPDAELPKDEVERTRVLLTKLREQIKQLSGM